MQNRIFTRLVSDMTKVNDNSHTIHFIDDFPPKVRQAAVRRFPTTATDPIMRVVRKLDNAHAEFLEQA